MASIDFGCVKEEPLAFSAEKGPGEGQAPTATESESVSASFPVTPGEIARSLGGQRFQWHRLGAVPVAGENSSLVPKHQTRGSTLRKTSPIWNLFNCPVLEQGGPEGQDLFVDQAQGQESEAAQRQGQEAEGRRQEQPRSAQDKEPALQPKLKELEAECRLCGATLMQSWYTKDRRTQLTYFVAYARMMNKMYAHANNCHLDKWSKVVREYGLAKNGRPRKTPRTCAEDWLPGPPPAVRKRGRPRNDGYSGEGRLVGLPPAARKLLLARKHARPLRPLAPRPSGFGVPRPLGQMGLMPRGQIVSGPGERPVPVPSAHGARGPTRHDATEATNLTGAVARAAAGKEAEGTNDRVTVSHQLDPAVGKQPEVISPAGRVKRTKRIGALKGRRVAEVKRARALRVVELVDGDKREEDILFVTGDEHTAPSQVGGDKQRVTGDKQGASSHASAGPGRGPGEVQQNQQHGQSQLQPQELASSALPAVASGRRSMVAMMSTLLSL